MIIPGFFIRYKNEQGLYLYKKLLLHTQLLIKFLEYLVFKMYDNIRFLHILYKYTRFYIYVEKYCVWVDWYWYFYTLDKLFSGPLPVAEAIIGEVNL